MLYDSIRAAIPVSMRRPLHPARLVPQAHHELGWCRPLTLSREFTLSAAEGKGVSGCRSVYPLVWFDKLTTSGRDSSTPDLRRGFVALHKNPGRFILSTPKGVGGCSPGPDLSGGRWGSVPMVSGRRKEGRGMVKGAQ